MHSYKLKFVIIALMIGGSAFLFQSSWFRSGVLIESEESRTKDLTPVFNQIKWISTSERDIWMMNQSHYGVHAKANQWERLAIIVDKTKHPMSARFYQVKPGALEWSEDLPNKRVPYRASCFTCHSDGPRAIRPEGEMPVLDKVKVGLWNFRIKTYGRIHYDQSHDLEDVTLYPPFHYEGKGERDKLKIATCSRCHNEDGFFARGELERQQSGTIKRMVESGHMPPPGFSLSASEKKQLRDFLRGF